MSGDPVLFPSSLNPCDFLILLYLQDYSFRLLHLDLFALNLLISAVFLDLSLAFSLLDCIPVRLIALPCNGPLQVKTVWIIPCLLSRVFEPFCVVSVLQLIVVVKWSLTMYFRSMNGSLMATTLMPFWRQALRTRRPIRPNLEGAGEEISYTGYELHWVWVTLGMSFEGTISNKGVVWECLALCVGGWYLWYPQGMNVYFNPFLIVSAQVLAYLRVKEEIWGILSMCVTVELLTHWFQHKGLTWLLLIGL